MHEPALSQRLDTLWRMESPVLIARLARLLGGDVGRAEELAQDTWLAALERWPTQGVPDNPGAWLMTTARNRAIDVLRQHQRVAGQHARWGSELVPQPGPLPAGRLDPQTALQFGIGLAAFSLFLMLFASNWQATLLLAASILFYVFVYTMWLKPRTPQNIVIGGGAGAFPPLIGWVAVTGEITAMPILLFAIIFFWTPPHFWALALFVQSDYAKVGIPMLPVVAGEKVTRRQIMIYTLLLAPIAIAPWAIGGTSWIYGSVAVVLSVLFVVLAMPVFTRMRAEVDAMAPEKTLFKYSIVYLFVLFAALVADRVAAYQGWIA